MIGRMVLALGVCIAVCAVVSLMGGPTWAQFGFSLGPVRWVLFDRMFDSDAAKGDG